MPVRDFLLDSDGDLAVENGDFALAGGDTLAENQAAAEQGVAIRARFFLAESWLDEAQGIDYIGKVFVKGTNPLVVREMIRSNVADTPDVTEVIAGNLTRADREGTLPLSVRSVYSEASVDLSVSVP